MAPYSILGISMLLIVSVAIYHFNNVDIQKAQERNALTMDMETFYSTVKVGQDLQQIARVSSEKTVLENSVSTYENPINVNEKWNSPENFNKWKSDLAGKISEESKKEIFDFYHGGDEEALEKQYYNPSTDFNFANFIKKDDIEVSVTQDSYDPSTKTQKSLELNVAFKDGGIVSSTNKFTGYEMSMSAGTNVSVDSRPFTMADKAYEFTNTFNKQEEANQLSWYLWGAQTVLGLMEANVKRDVRYATDDRVSYSLMHLIVAYEELETFGTFDYVHTTMEFLRPWIGADDGASEFLSLLSLSMDESYVDQAIASMESAAFVSDVAEKVQDISDSMILASSYIDSETVTVGGTGFEKTEVAEAQLSGEGVVQHLVKANDTQKLTGVHDEITKKRKKVTDSKNNVEDDTIDSLNVANQISILTTEYKEVRDEWDEANNDFKKSQSEVNSVRDGYSSLSSEIEGEICDNPIAAMLWFGGSNQKVKGFREILSAKVNETDELLGYYSELEKNIGALSYESVKDSYEIDEHYDSAIRSLNDAEASMQSARAARNEYLDQKYKHDHCYTHFDEKDPEMGECLGPGEDCNPYRCNPYECDCVTVTDKDGDTSESCQICWNTCYQTCYYCVCDKEVLKDNYEGASETYVNQMWLTEDSLTDAAPEVASLQKQINTFFLDKGLADVYSMIEGAHGMNDEVTTETLKRAPSPYSISNNYYGHWDYTPCSNDKKYNCAKTLVPDPIDIDETNYNTSMPKSPLTYDTSHEDYADYGLYYIKYMIDKMDETFVDSSINAEELQKGRDTLEEMKRNGFFKKINAIITPMKELVDTAGDIKSSIAKLQNAEADFPNIKEHFYTTLQLPPFNGSDIGFDYQGFTVIHDIHLRSDTSPGEIKIPIIETVKLGSDRKTNPSLPIPYTPINVYVWQFEVGASKTGNTSDGDLESSLFWLIDTESSQIAPLMEMKVTEFDEIFDVPLYLHKPTMYKYEFEPEATISKGLDSLPPVFILALGPFKTRFGDFVEPPDKEITDGPIPVDVSFDRVFANESTDMKVDIHKENVYIWTYLSEAVSLDKKIISTGIYKDETVSKDDLKFLDEYGWSEVKADTYAVSGDVFDKNIIQGEDHARVYFIDLSLTSVGIELERDGTNLTVFNTGDKKVDVTINPVSTDSCIFIFFDGNMMNNWIGTVPPDGQVDLSVTGGSPKITAEVLIPEKVKQELENRGIPLTLKAQT